MYLRDSFETTRERLPQDEIKNWKLEIGNWGKRRFYVIGRWYGIASLEVVIRAVHADSRWIVGLSNIVLNFFRDLSSLTSR